MGKNYIESSLKRFLKRKVKITLGLVVTFLITGMVSFAEENDIKQESNKNHWEWNQVDEAEKYLISTKDKFEGNLSGNYIKIEDNGSKISYDIINTLFDRDNIDRNFTSTSITFEKEKISDKTLKNIDSTLKILDTNFNQKFSDDEVKNIGIINNIDNTEYNKGINLIGQENVTVTKGLIESGNVTVEKGKIGINIGTINNTQNGTGSTLYNYGIIKGGQTGENVYNYGFLSQPASSLAQDITKVGYNYGMIASTQNGQMITSKSGKSYNYGIILSGSLGGPNDFGQYSRASNTYIENNGIIDGVRGQGIFNYNSNKNINSSIVNKGTIFATLIGTKISGERDNISYNYGIISTVAKGNVKNAVGQEITGKGENNKAYNFGKIIGDNGQKFYRSWI